tara:strand:- start:3774 stop:4541 length:768 start_codon:yes stop_codon:yes gene_type:complete
LVTDFKKMKKVILIWSLIILVACDSENAPECIRSEGTITQVEINVPLFSKILVNNKIQLFISESTEQKVIVETGENIFNAIEINVDGDLLTLTNNMNCNFVRDYGLTKVYVSAPNVSEITNNSEFMITGIGLLNYPDLSLISDDFSNQEYYNNGDFDLEINTENLRIIANGFSNFFLKGVVLNANIGLYAGDSRVEAADLVIQNLNVFHRSTNKMIVNPQQSITGEIRSLGDVISKNIPPIIDVVEYFTGALIFD